MTETTDRGQQRPKPELDGDCLSCSECGSTRLVATEQVKHRYEVYPTVDLPTGTGKPVLRLRHRHEKSLSMLVYCADCEATLNIDAFDTKEI